MHKKSIAKLIQIKLMKTKKLYKINKTLKINSYKLINLCSHMKEHQEKNNKDQILGNSVWKISQKN